ncbi:MAG: glycoside hydrolase family 20 zincin-like fold domain-containing protein, partial [Patescibacteria group bacterium]|nr:glycoside hydrolase family 20 zincin-like fold domain-containing protein [Patescibacteria group bacterium]
GAEKLRGLKNDDQAYVIAPLADRGLAVAALTDRGVYHGVKTLAQMLEAGSDKESLTLPIVAVLDWPDLAERGQWTFEERAPGDIQYMADRKMNLLEVRTPAGFDDKRRGTLDVNVASMAEARRRAVNWLPFIAHLANQAYRTDIYTLYPETQGRGPRARHARVPNDASADIVVPCASHPQFIQVLAEWLMSAAEKGATEVNVFLSELEGMGCECEQCKGKSQFALEAKACVKAWRIAQDKYPELRLRILLSQGSYDTNDQVLAAVPETEVGITYYSGSSRGKIPGYASSTYTASKDPMIYPLMMDFVNQGRWLGCYPSVTATYRVATPWSGPQFMKFRMTEFVDKGLASVSGYIPPDKQFFDFNFTALAEWSWNAHGRTEHEFAAAWATRRGLADPDKAADWAVMLGPVGWDVYGSNAPTFFLGRAAAMVERRQKPQLGAGMFRYFPTVEHMDENLAVCQQALDLAQQVGDPAVIAETRVIEGYVRMIKSIYLIADAVAGRKELDDAQTASVQAAADALRSAAKQTTEALRAWNRAVATDYDLGDPASGGAWRITMWPATSRRPSPTSESPSRRWESAENSTGRRAWPDAEPCLGGPPVP